MAKQTRLATTLTARYFPTSELTDAFYMDGRVTSKTTARSAEVFSSPFFLIRRSQIRIPMLYRLMSLYSAV